MDSDISLHPFESEVKSAIAGPAVGIDRKLSKAVVLEEVGGLEVGLSVDAGDGAEVGKKLCSSVR